MPQQLAEGPGLESLKMIRRRLVAAALAVRALPIATVALALLATVVVADWVWALPAVVRLTALVAAAVVAVAALVAGYRAVARRDSRGSR